jgi:hypothetical protein
MFIPDPDHSFFLPVPDPGVKKAPDPRSWIRNTAGKLSTLHFLILLGNVRSDNNSPKVRTSLIADPDPAFDDMNWTTLVKKLVLWIRNAFNADPGPAF